MRRFGTSFVLLLALLVGLFAMAPAAHANDVDDEWAFVRDINQARADSGLAPLTAYGPLRDVARAQSVRMGQSSTLYHNPNLREDIARVAPDWQRAGENVGQGYDVDGLHRAFMNSAGHRANILGDFNYLGVGVVHANGYTWVTEVFLKAPGGKPALQAVAPAPPPPPVPVDRIAGTADGDTSIAVARRFPDGGSDAVVVGRSDVFADALAGGPLAAVNHGPVLLTAPNAASADVVAEARRVLRPGGRVFLLGGSSALSPAVEAAFTDAGLTVERIGGVDRYDTAVAVAQRIAAAPSEVFVVSGTNFADAMVAGPVAGPRTAPILLAAPDGLTLGTQAYLLTVPAARRTVIGGTAAVSDVAAQQAGANERVAGADRYDTAVKVAARWLADAPELSFATGTSFADALAGAAWSAREGMPLVLLSTIPGTATRTYVKSTVSHLDSTVVYGTSAALPDSAVAWAFN